MENKKGYFYSLIVEAFEEYHSQLFSYIRCKISNKDDVEDLLQDTFLNLLCYEDVLYKDTIKSLIFITAKNLVTDYLRRFYKKQEITLYMMETSSIENDFSESLIVAKDLGRQEKWKMSKLPIRRKQIYYMNRFLYMSASEISDRLSLSKRTVENHLLLGRRDVREYMKKHI